VDAVCTAYGFLPSLELPRALGCALEGGAVAHDEDMRTSAPHVFVAGEAAGVGGAELAVLEGTIAGRAAAGAADDQTARRRRRHAARFAAVLDDLFRPRPGLFELPDANTVLCRCEDVTAGEVDAAAGDSLSALKIATRCGQGPCQGRICAELVGARLPGAEDDFTSRPPLRPVAVSTLMDSG
jgi:NAD(P)H-nitrite reductase large subunit